MKKILYIEDARAQREIMKQMLELKGQYQVSIADHGQEGLEKARAEHPDVILMDLRMPILSGQDTIKALKADPDLAGIPIIAISAWADQKSRDSTLAAGAVKFFEKPINYNKLIAELENLTGNN